VLNAARDRFRGPSNTQAIIRTPASFQIGRQAYTRRDEWCFN
jgi:hypothetical protein